MPIKTVALDPLMVAVHSSPTKLASLELSSVPVWLSVACQRIVLAPLVSKTKSFRFPDPTSLEKAGIDQAPSDQETSSTASVRKRTKLTPPANVFSIKDRLFYALQPPVETWLANKSIKLPFQPFPYQTQGIAFLVPSYGALLGDEMGLGKTMQAIVSIRMLLGSGMAQKVLLVCPKPLVSNWIHEFKQWAGDIAPVIVSGPTRKRQAIWDLPNLPVKMVNYEVLTRDIRYLEETNTQFDLVVLDEAQRIKNEHSQTAKAVRSLSRTRSWALSGTPMENRPEDLISIMRFVEPGLNHHPTSHAKLREMTAPYLLRRLKEQVLTQLPAKIVRDTHLDLTANQAQTYETAERDGVMRLNELGDSLSIQNVFELVLRLKQICNFDPATGESAKLEQLKNDMEEIAASGRKALIFSQWVNTLRTIKEHLGEYSPLEFHGQIASRARENTIEEFRSNPDCNVLLLSYGAGSVGLNLQFAQYVFLFDRWWNPAVEDQAINRVYRIGQKDKVTITRFLTSGTIEERISEILDKKRELANEIVPGSEYSSSGLKEDEIFGLFDIQVRPKRKAA